MTARLLQTESLTILRVQQKYIRLSALCVDGVNCIKNTVRDGEFLRGWVVFEKGREEEEGLPT